MNNINNHIGNLKMNINQKANLNANNLNNSSMNLLMQYFNIMNSNMRNNSNYNNNNYNNNNFINTNKNYQNNILNINSSNIFQFIPYITNLGFNQPYTFENTKKESKIIYPSNFKTKLNYRTKENQKISEDNNYNIIDINEDDNIEKKFMRKMTKAEKIEIDKWFEARKKLYPTQKNIELKKKMGEIKVEKGLMSELELKLRKKVNILKKLNSHKKIITINNFGFNKNSNNLKEKKNQNKDFIQNNNDNLKEKENENKILDNNNEKKINILENGEIDGGEKKNEGNKNLMGRKRDRKNNNIKKKLGKKINNNKNNKGNKIENGFKKGFRYKENNLYDELIKKEKIKEQNIILQAIRYLINLKEDEIK